MGAHSSMGGGALSVMCAKDMGGRSFEHGRLDGRLRYVSRPDKKISENLFML